ncbi:MAG: hypothetical protein JST40_05335 [Armatimonadetes bacterium]|nr:hypothetical protein [Armatimonadota bacterium]
MVSLALSLTIQSQVLWSIGVPDGKPAEFGLFKPNGYREYRDDALFIVGSSKPADWCYVLPGPSDIWAGSRLHQADIFFGLGQFKGDSQFTLEVNFADSQASTGPTLELLVNGKRIGYFQPKMGQGDEVVEGKASQGTPSRWQIDIPADALAAGDNRVSIRNGSGSWAIFDSISFSGPAGVDVKAPHQQLSLDALPPIQAILRKPEGPRQEIRMLVSNIGAPSRAKLSSGAVSQEIHLKSGRQTVSLFVPPVQKATEQTVQCVSATDPNARASCVVKLEKVRPWTIYLLPHSHLDIGYTNPQAYLREMHMRNFYDALDVVSETASNPAGSQYRFTAEGTWTLDHLVRDPSKLNKERVIKGLKNGTMAVTAAFTNQLTGVMAPEELMQSYRYGKILEGQFGVPMDTASQTDIPGATWGTLVAMKEAGIKYFVLMPNPGDRIGDMRREWEDKPFYWIAPNGKDKLLVWELITYGVGHNVGWSGDRSKIQRSNHPLDRFIDRSIFDHLGRLDAKGYPYNMVAVPWSSIDNAVIDADVPVATKAWNEKYVVPKIQLSTVREACVALETQYGSKLPSFKGDLTPYWEDGVGSSAAETAIHRTLSDRLIQAETLYAMNRSRKFPTDEFMQAWRNVLEYSEHTWGAWNSVSNPDGPEQTEQWAVKSGYLKSANHLADKLMAQAKGRAPTTNELDIINTTSWDRSDLVLIAAEMSEGRDFATTASGSPLSSQRLSTGELAVLAKGVPAFGKLRIKLKPGKLPKPPSQDRRLATKENVLEFDPNTGAIKSWISRGGAELVDQRAVHQLGQYLYLPGSDLKDLTTTSRSRFNVIENGPLVKKIEITASADGVNSIKQTAALVEGLDRVEWAISMDKKAVREKESVHIAFPFAIPNPQQRIQMPWAVVRPDVDQLPGSNKNWFPVAGYFDVSNSKRGVTCVPLDAPLLECGEISARMLDGGYNSSDWRKTVGPTATFYSWALNNHWYTNYRADQCGPLSFRYVLQAHGAYDPVSALKTSMAARQPLIAVAASKFQGQPLLKLKNSNVVATRMCPSLDGRAVILRIYNPTASDAKTELRLSPGWVESVYATDLSEKPKARLSDTVAVPANGVRTLRLELE